MSGQCEYGKTCNNHMFFIGITGLWWTVSYMSIKPILNSIELSVSKFEVTFAFGIYIAMYRIIGAISSPKITGILIDMACLLFSNNTCRFYNTAKYGLYMMYLILASKVAAVVLGGFAIWFSIKLKTRPGEESIKTGPAEEEEKN